MRDYAIKTALDHISFQIEEGELVGYICPNGAGKSTTVKILSGILVPNNGNVKVMGKTPWQHRIETVQQLGVVFGQRTQLWWDLPVIEGLSCHSQSTFCHFASIPGSSACRTVDPVFWGAVKVMILTAFYAQASGVQPLSLEQAVTFIWMGQALLQLLPWNIDKEIEAQVKSGNVAFELIRPLDLYWLWFCRSMAMRLVPTLLRSIPLFVLGGLFFGLAQPVSWLAAAAFGASLIFSALLSFTITTLVIITLFWTVSGEGILRLLPHVVVVFSGMTVPLPLFPEWMQPFLNIQPFRCIIDIPCRLYTGVIPSSEALYYLAFQFVWVLGFIAAGRLLMKRVINQFVIQGG